MGFKNYLVESEIAATILESHGTFDAFLTESAANVVDREKYEQANAIAKTKSDENTENAKAGIEHHLGNYGRSLHDKGHLEHLGDDELHSERDRHLTHLKNLHANDRKSYDKLVAGAKKRLPVEPHGVNKKTATMAGEHVDGKEVIASISNKGAAASVAKIGKGGKTKMQSTCVNSKQSCRGEGPHNIGAPCLGKIGCFAYPGVKESNTTNENLRTMKAHSDKPEHSYGYSHGGKDVKASPHLDYATHEYHSLVNGAEHAHDESKKSKAHKLVVFRQNTQNEHSSMHFDQLTHHLPDHLKPHVATNNYSATPAKGHYDPKNPSDASTHDGKLNNTNFSVKGPHVVHDQHGNVLGHNKSSNLEDTKKALHVGKDKDGNITRPAQNAYAVVGGRHEGHMMRYPKNKITKDEAGNETNQKAPFHKDSAPAYFKPFARMNKVKTARIYEKERDLKPGEAPDHHHPDGWGHSTHHDPHTGKHRTFDYQDHHVHVNAPKPDKKGHIDFASLNDNVGSDDRKPHGAEVRKDREGHQVGAIHISAPTSATPNTSSEGVQNTKNGKKVADKHGLSNDPFVHPMQHHLDDKDETLFHVNHPKHQFAAEEAERKEKAKGTPVKFVKHEDAPQTKSERGELKTESVNEISEAIKWLSKK